MQKKQLSFAGELLRLMNGLPVRIRDPVAHQIALNAYIWRCRRFKVPVRWRKVMRPVFARFPTSALVHLIDLPAREFGEHLLQLADYCKKND